MACYGHTGLSARQRFLPRGSYLYIGTYSGSDNAVYIYRLLLQGTNSLELVGRIPAQPEFRMQMINAMIGLRNDPNVLLLATQNEGSYCGGGNSGLRFKSDTRRQFGTHVQLSRCPEPFTYSASGRSF